MDICEIRQLLLQRRASLQSRCAQITQDSHQLHAKRWAEQAQERENDEVLAAIDDEATRTILQINSALERIDNGRYGLCEDCGKAIIETRLVAMPETTLCTDCAMLH